MRANSLHVPPNPPLEPGWLVVDGIPLYHRVSVAAGTEAPAIVHVHGFGISGTYLEPTAARLTSRYRTFVPDLPGHGRSMRPDRPIDLPGLAASLISYCDAIGIDRATFVGNSLGCPVICEVATSFHDRIDGAVLVSPAGGVNNQPLARAIGQMARDSIREPLSMVPIAVRDYLHFGPIAGFSLFRAMTRFPTLERVRHLDVPTLVVAGERDPLVNVGRVHVFSGLPHVRVVVVPGAHALNFSAPELIAALVDAHMTQAPLQGDGVLTQVTELEIPA